MKLKALKAALPYTLPLALGFIFIGISFGLLMNSLGFDFYYPILMSMFIYAGSMQFVAANILIAPFAPLQAFLLAIMVNARHISYGISMLDKYKNTGLKKSYLIFAMCDETFSVNCTVSPPKDVDKSWFMFFVSLVNHLFWNLGTALGSFLGYVVDINTEGIEFVMTALFVVIFINQWEAVKNHFPALIGLGNTLICLLIFGASNFLIWAMLSIVLLLTVFHKRSEVEVNK